MTSNKSALKLIEEYDDGLSSDEEIPGARVSVKRTFKEDKQTVRIPLPEFIKSNQVSQDWIDEPEKHDGRKRSFAHERGNWATFVYISYQPCQAFENFVEEVRKTIANVELQKVSDFHISLTKTVVLKYHWIHPFINSVKHNISHFKRFILLFDSLKVYCNEERTRTFLGVTMKSGLDVLLYLVQALNNSLAEFHLPSFYKDPSFHMSILWCLGDHENELNVVLEILKLKLNQFINLYCEEPWFIEVNYLYCKSGNKVFQYPLS